MRSNRSKRKRKLGGAKTVSVVPSRSQSHKGSKAELNVASSVYQRSQDGGRSRSLKRLCSGVDYEEGVTYRLVDVHACSECPRAGVGNVPASLQDPIIAENRAHLPTTLSTDTSVVALKPIDIRDKCATSHSPVLWLPRKRKFDDSTTESDCYTLIHSPSFTLCRQRLILNYNGGSLTDLFATDMAQRSYQSTPSQTAMVSTPVISNNMPPAPADLSTATPTVPVVMATNNSSQKQSDTAASDTSPYAPSDTTGTPPTNSGDTMYATPMSTPEQADTSSSNDDSESPFKDGKKRNRCRTCRKKVGLTGFECRCGGLYCGIHRYSDKHDCQYDYKELGAAEIRKNNPVIKGEKIQKL